MACKRPGVRVPLAPLHFRSQISNTKPVVLTTVEGQNEGQSAVSGLGLLTSTDLHGSLVLSCRDGFGGEQEVMRLRVRT